MSAKTIAISTLLVLGACALIAGCGSDDNPVTPTPSNDAPILPPQNVIASRSTNGSVMVSWTANTQSNLLGYKVYRHDVDNSAILTLTPTPITVTHYEDATATNGTYEYRVTSVSSKGDESGFATQTIVVRDSRGGGKYDRDN